MNIEIECKELDGRIVPTGPIWDKHEHTLCIHGEKLSWTCDECAENIEESQIPEPPVLCGHCRKPVRLKPDGPHSWVHEDTGRMACRLSITDYAP